MTADALSDSGLGSVHASTSHGMLTRTIELPSLDALPVLIALDGEEHRICFILLTQRDTVPGRRGGTRR